MKERNSDYFQHQQIDLLTLEVVSKTHDIDDVNSISEQVANDLSDRIKFSEKNSWLNPKEIEANCVGYAEIYSAVLNKIFTSLDLPNQARHVIGQIHFCGLNLHNFANRSFFKDHDYVEITNK